MNLRTDSEKASQCVAAVAQAIAHAVEARPTIEDVFMLLATEKNLDSTGEIELPQVDIQLWARVRDVVQCHPLHALGGLALRVLRSCPAQDALPPVWRDSRRLERWNAFKQVLRETRAGGIDGLNLVPVTVETSADEATLLRYHPAAPLSSEDLRDLPWAMMQHTEQPCITSGTNVFEPPRKEPAPTVPDGLNLRFLRRDMADKLRGMEQGVEFLRHTLGVGKCEFNGLVRKTVLPLLDAGSQPNGVLMFLRELQRAVGSYSDGPFDWNDEVRAALSRKCRVLCCDESQRFAIEVYAGTEWTGTDYLERCFGSADTHGFLVPPPDAEDERKEWERFYRWLGVGWCPKVLPVAGGTDRCQLRWDERTGRFEAPSKAGDVEKWAEYSHDMKARFLAESHYPAMLENFTLDGGMRILEQDGALACIAREWSSYARRRKCKVRYSSTKRRDSEDKEKDCPSHLQWLMARACWLPDAQGKMHSPDVLFFAGDVTRSLAHWATEFDPDALAKDCELKTADVRRVAEASGVRHGWGKSMM